MMKQGHLINKINRLIPIANATPLSEFYDDDDIPNIIETDYLPNLKKIDETQNDKI